MRLSKNFTLHEFTKSDTATQKGIDNSAPTRVIDNLTILAQKVLQPLREWVCSLIIVNSGYRCAELNRAVGGAKNSQHLTGEAVDITAGSKERNRVLFEWIRDNCQFDQLIWERDGAWIHVSYREGENRGQILSL